MIIKEIKKTLFALNKHLSNMLYMNSIQTFQHALYLEEILCINHNVAYWDIYSQLLFLCSLISWLRY